jgi:UPF0755 protein
MFTLRKREKKALAVASPFIIVGVAIWYLFFTVPFNYPNGAPVRVGEGDSVADVASWLKEKHFIRSALLFRVWVKVLGKEQAIAPGYYHTTENMKFFPLAGKLVSGKIDDPLIRLTIPEGSTDYEVATFVNHVLPKISIHTFGEKILANKATGKLYPETYFLLPSATADSVIGKMVDQYEKSSVAYNTVHQGEYEAVKARLRLLGVKEKDFESAILKFASVIEGEADTPEDMRIVGGILWKRLELGMRLQVDVAKETYLRPGLPNHILNNPGAAGLEGVYNPIKTKYLFYLTGKDGKMYYAEDYEEHKVNIRKYLR